MFWKVQHHHFQLYAMMVHISALIYAVLQSTLLTFFVQKVESGNTNLRWEKALCPLEVN